MMARFGGWSQYRTAPRHVVEEQLIAWNERRRAEADIHRENNPS